MKATSVVLLACAAALTSGCATITRGTTVDFVVESEPPGAAVKTSNGFVCPATPCTFKMPRKDSFDVTLSKAGFVEQSGHITSLMSGGGATGMAGNILIGGLIGVAVDASSGAMNDLTPNPLKVTLAAVPAAAPAPTAPTPTAPTAAPVAEAPTAPVVNAAAPAQPLAVQPAN
jgi:hypothetical protein